MLIRHCGYCNENVDLDAGPHVHDPKKCQDCGEVLPISSFPVHKASCDGHRHSCVECCAKRQAAVADQARERAADFRKEESALLRSNGYQWVRGNEVRWLLLDRNGAIVDRDQVVAELRRQAAESADDDGTEVSLWQERMSPSPVTPRSMTAESSEGVGARVWLDLPFEEKDAAKAAGARWDPDARRWYAPNTATAALERWRAAPSIPDLLPGEDRSLGSGLFVDLIPRSCWFTNARSCIDPKDWERVRRMVTQRAADRCEACGTTRGQDGAVLHVHERWTYDEKHGVQTLRRLICLCAECHDATHYGRAQIMETDAEARAHLAKVTGMTKKQVQAHIHEAVDLWRRRSELTWRLDLTILTDAGVTVQTPPRPAERATIARNLLLEGG